MPSVPSQELLESKIKEWLATADNDESAIEWVMYHLRRAFADADDLDEAALKCSRASTFRVDLERAMRNQGKAWETLVKVARLPMDGRAAKSVDFGRQHPFLLVTLGEFLCDGMPVEKAVERFADEMRDIAAAGDWARIISFGERLKAHKAKGSSRSDEAWILRSWLPLLLWEKSAPERAASLRLAWELLRSAGVSMSTFPEATIESKVNRVKARINAGRR